MAKGAEAMGSAWSEAPLDTVSAPKGDSPPCVFRGFCRFVCSTNAKQSQSNQSALGYMDEVVRACKAPPSTTITEHGNYDDRKDFFGGYCWMSQGPLPIEAMTILTGSKGLWGADLQQEMLRYNHLVGLKMGGEQLPNPDNRVTLADDTDPYGLRIPHISYSWPDNDKAMIRHALNQMSESLEQVGAKDIFR